MAYAQDLGSVASRPGGQPSSASAEDAAEIVSQTYSVLYGLNWGSVAHAPYSQPPGGPRAYPANASPAGYRDVELHRG